MHNHEHYRLRVAATIGAAAAHLYLAVLGAIGFLNYTVPTKYALLDEVASDRLWTWIHFTCAALLLISLARPNHRVPKTEMTYVVVACSIGFAAMFTWAFFNLMWGLTTVRPVSLAGPGLAFVVAAGEQLLAQSWYRGALTRDR